MLEPLTNEQVATWRSAGFVAVEGFFSETEVQAAVDEAGAHFPTPEEYRAAGKSRSRLAHPCPTCKQPFTQQGMMFQFLPYAGPALNALALGHRVISAAEQLLGTGDLRLTQSLLRATYGGPETRNQRLHRDYPANTLLTPPAHGTFGQLPVLIYLTDVTIEDAPTYIVSNRISDDRPLIPVEADDQLYEHEVPSLVRAGTAMFYTMRTFHRGSAAPAPDAHRLVHHAVYRAAGYDWMANMAWPPSFGDGDDGRRCIEELDPRQRQLLGIPAPGHPFWTAETIDGFIARYPKADAQPYLAAI